MRRGEIWWAELDAPHASEPGYRRPVLILQADFLNRSRLATVIAVNLTSNLALAALPGNVRLSVRDTGLPKDSVANVTQLGTLDRSQLLQRAGRLPDRLIAVVEDGLRLVLDL